MKNIFIKTTSSVLLLSFASLLYSDGDGEVAMRTNFFKDNNGTAIRIPSLKYSRDLWSDLKVVVQYSLNQVIVPPIRGISANPSPSNVDGITGASRPISGDRPASESFTKNRSEIVGTLTLSNTGLSFYYSDESDYHARMASVFINFDLNQKNTNVAASYSFGWDDIRPLNIDTSHVKTSHNLNVVLTQALSPVIIGRIGLDFSHIDGFQSNPYRTVHDGEEVQLENHPLWRNRGALFVKLNRYFKTRTSINLEYRYYRDDWDVKSQTISVAYYQYMSDKVLIRYKYRFYEQTAANFYRQKYSLAQTYMTSDYKLQSFTAHTFGLKIEYKLRELLENGLLSFMANSSFEAKYDRYFSSNDFTADIFQFGLIINY